MSLVDASHVSRRFGEISAVEDVSMSLDGGEIVGLFGANGAGKTTLIRMILGLLTPTTGSIRTLGTPAGDDGRRALGYLPQSLGLYPDLTVTENIAFAAKAHGVPTPRLDSTLAPVADRRIAHVSLGLRRRTAFMAASCHEPKLLILDEPTSGVGPMGRVELWEMIHEAADRGTGVLVSTHYMEEAEECDRVLVMTKGRAVASGSVAELIGTRQAVRVAGAGPAAIDRLRAAGLTVLPSGRDWRVLVSDPARVAAIVGAGADISSTPATFEETFVDLSQ